MSIIRIGLFYDGGYLNEALKFFRFHREETLTIDDIEDFARQNVSDFMKTDLNLIQVVKKEYFRGRFSASTAIERQKLSQERHMEQDLLDSGIQPHFFPVDESQIPAREKGIDVWLSLNAYHEIMNNSIDVLAIVAGDADYVPLLRKAKAAGTVTMVIAWDFEYTFEQGGRTIQKQTTTSRTLQKEAMIVARMV